MIDAEDLLSIVIVGAMNPAIHHFAWYQLVGIITQDEAESASRDSAVVASAQVSQFGFRSMRVTCDPSRWQIQVSDTEEFSRAVGIAEKTFNVLYHTPVTAFGLNFMCHRPTRLPKVRNTLARLIENVPLGFVRSAHDESAAKVMYEHGSGGRILRISVEPSVRGENQIYVATNVDHRGPVVHEGEFKQWDLKLEESFPKDYAEAQAQLTNVVEALNRLEEN